ncbi:MAG: YfcE family phosphodiesterase [Oscillospiraceae bacterium]|nr:YfcE family phosphodiesterase [Oscillospiraceae bacterium]
MKVLVVSDSHGDVENMCRAVEREQPRMLLHLGDGWRDAELLAERYPDLPIEKVAGNCDFRAGEPAVRVIMIAGKRIMLCHGHTLGVKTNLSMLLREAIERKADAALFGHTHEPFVDIRAGVVMLNPGSVGNYRRPTYGTLSFEDGKCLPATYILK